MTMGISFLRRPSLFSTVHYDVPRICFQHTSAVNPSSLLMTTKPRLPLPFDATVTSDPGRL